MDRCTHCVRERTDGAVRCRQTGAFSDWTALRMTIPPCIHDSSGAIRFYVRINGIPVGALVSKEALHYRYRPDANGEDAMDTYLANAADIEAAVRRRVAKGSIEPVMLREADLHTPA